MPNTIIPCTQRHAESKHNPGVAKSASLICRDVNLAAGPDKSIIGSARPLLRLSPPLMRFLLR